MLYMNLNKTASHCPLQKWLHFASVKLMGDGNFDQKLTGVIGKPKKASSYLFYLSENGVRDEIISYFQTSLRAETTDVILISPEDSEGKKEIISIKQTKEAIHFVSLSPSGQAKIAAINRAELLNKESANAFLKTLEEPPKNSVILLFAASRVILPTIKSRCKIFNFQKEAIGDEAADEEIISSLCGSFKEVSDAIEALIKEEKTAKLTAVLERYARKKLLKERSKEAVKFIKEVEKAKRDIRANANPKLTIESLVLKNSKLIEDICQST